MQSSKTKTLRQFSNGSFKEKMKTSFAGAPGRMRARQELNSFVTHHFIASQFHHHCRKPSEWLAPASISIRAEKFIPTFHPDAQLFVTFIFPICRLHDEWIFFELMEFEKQTSVLPCLSWTTVAWVHRLLKSCWSHNFIWHAWWPLTRPWMPRKNGRKSSNVETRFHASKYVQSITGTLPPQEKPDFMKN